MHCVTKCKELVSLISILASLQSWAMAVKIGGGTWKGAPPPWKNQGEGGWWVRFTWRAKEKLCYTKEERQTAGVGGWVGDVVEAISQEEQGKVCSAPPHLWTLRLVIFLYTLVIFDFKGMRKMIQPQHEEKTPSKAMENRDPPDLDNVSSFLALCWGMASLSQWSCERLSKQKRAAGDQKFGSCARCSCPL